MFDKKNAVNSVSHIIAFCEFARLQTMETCVKMVTLSLTRSLQLLKQHFNETALIEEYKIHAWLRYLRDCDAVFLTAIACKT